MSIYIFSRPIHSGKTTELINWCNRQKNIAGILMPDIDGNRKIYNIATKEVFDIECGEPLNTSERLTSAGRFNFYTSAFEKANAILLTALSQNPNWLVIDEAGKLELGGKGFYSSLMSIVNSYNNNIGSGNLLITVRESLCAEVIGFLKIKNYKIIRQLQELD